MPGWLPVRVDPLDPHFGTNWVEALEGEGFEVHTEQQLDVNSADVVVKVVIVEGGTASAWAVATALKRSRERRKIGPRVVIIDVEADNDPPPHSRQIDIAQTEVGWSSGGASRSSPTNDSSSLLGEPGVRVETTTSGRLFSR